MTLADIIREKEAVALLCPVCRRWHPIKAKLTDITEKEYTEIACRPDSDPTIARVESWRGISISKGNEKEFDDPLYKIFTDVIERFVTKFGGNYSFYVKDDKFYFKVSGCYYSDSVPDRCSTEGGFISLNDLDKNLFFVEVKPCREDYRYSATMEILFFIKCKWPCESCVAAKLSEDSWECGFYNAALKRYLKGMQKTEAFEKTFVLGFRYNLTEDEIKGFPSYYNLLELRRKYSDSHELEGRVYSDIGRLEKLISRERITEFDGYEDTIQKEEELIERLKSFLKKTKGSSPDEELRKQYEDFYWRIKMGMVYDNKISYSQAKKETLMMCRNRIKKMEDIFSASDSERLKAEQDKIESDISDFINRFEENLQKRRKQLEDD